MTSFTESPLIDLAEAFAACFRRRDAEGTRMPEHRTTRQKRAREQRKSSRAQRRQKPVVQAAGSSA